MHHITFIKFITRVWHFTLLIDIALFVPYKIYYLIFNFFLSVFSGMFQYSDGVNQGSNNMLENMYLIGM